MSIQEITFYMPPTEVNDCPKEPAFHLIKADINFLQEKFTDGMSYQDYYSGNRKATPTDIHYYSDIKALTKSYNFSENGFQYYQLEEGSPLASAIELDAIELDAIELNAEILGKEPFLMEEEPKLFSQVEQFLSSWGEANKIPGTPVIVSSVRRSSGSFGMAPFFFAHVDFSKKDIIDPLSHIGNIYKAGAEKVFGSMSNEDYKKIEHHAEINMWIPRHKKASHNTLTVMSTASVQNLSDKLRPASFSSGITSFSLHPDEKQEWVAANLTRQDRTIIIFDTTGTPHTAINIEGIPESPRDSLEIRVDFVSHPSLSPKVRSNVF